MTHHYELVRQPPYTNKDRRSVLRSCSSAWLSRGVRGSQTRGGWRLAEAGHTLNRTLPPQKFLSDARSCIVVWPTFSITSTTAYTNARVLFKKAVAASCLLFWKRFVILFTFRPKKKGRKEKAKK